MAASDPDEDRQAYAPPELVVLGTIGDLTEAGLVVGKEHGGNGRRPITLSNP